MNEIDDLISRYQDGFLRLDAGLLGSLWADQDIVYSPAELADPITSKVDLDAYYARVVRLFRDVEIMDVFAVRHQRLSDDVVAVHFGFRFRAHFVSGPLHVVAGRVSVVFRRDATGWHGVHYHESLTPGS
ncbi:MULTISPECIES: nuclear transport factor 2 family protein [unclassified Pseudofrankia]|uniref:YybH family protein n=1 Tax=unclassified Pseudofrankia TaxID=2994372 RepID=UPI0012FF864D|nr:MULTISPECIES: nuclear transport factor 2 family protein [unclassified Pseudofrankia]MDT3444178.1 nuclear transport factor 2 family protein [Pseudofrankia sp. BMG5.37]